MTMMPPAPVVPRKAAAIYSPPDSPVKAPAVDKPMDADDSADAPLPPTPHALAGLVLLLTGLGGMAAYLACILHPVLQFFATISALGAFLLLREIKLTDHIAFGLTVGDALAYSIRQAQAVCWQCAIIMSLPRVTGADIGIVFRGLASSGAGEGGATAASECKASEVGSPAAGAPSAGASEKRGFVGSERGFALAKEWLQRPDLAIGLGDQLALYGLYQRARMDRAPLAGKSEGTWIDQAKLDACKARADLSRAVARAELTATLARVDPCFAVAHPELAAPKYGDQAAMFLGLAERRLPSDLPAFFAAVHRHAFQASMALSASVLLRCLWLRASGRRPHRALVAAGALGTGLSAYTLALVRGMPAQMHVAIARLLGSRVTSPDASAAGRLLQYLFLLLVPRMRESLFVQ